MIVDGRAIAADIISDVRHRVEQLGRIPRVHALVVAPSPATESYLAIKKTRARDAGMELIVVPMAEASTTTDLIAMVERLETDAIIVQLPLPEHIDKTAVLNAVSVHKDADVLSYDAREQFQSGMPGALVPPVAEAVKEILIRSNVQIQGAYAVVVGEGWLVGAPSAALLSQLGADVRSISREEGPEGLEQLRSADIIVSGAGVAGLITPSLIKEGVALIDAGTSESGGAIVGDADPACASVATVFTPVPGGVGPVAVACLLRNVIRLMERGLQTS